MTSLDTPKPPLELHTITMPEQKPGVNKVPTTEVSVAKCEIRSVVVYGDRAAVKRVVHAHLSPGENKVIVNGLAEAVMKESIGVEGEGAAKITDVIYNTGTVTKVSDEVPQDGSSKMEYERMVAEIRERQKEMGYLKLKEEVLENEKSLLTTYASHVCRVQSAKGDSEDNTLNRLFREDTVKMVMEFYECYERKVATLDQSIIEVQDSIKKLNANIMVLQANAAKLDPSASRKITTTETVRSVHIGLDAAVETDVSLYISYVVSNSSWSPSYDIRVLPDENLMRIQYFGHIKQSTGEDWLNANVSLSTAQPSLGGSPPTLGEHTIKFTAPSYYSPKKKQRRKERDHYADERRASLEFRPEEFRRERRLSITMAHSHKRSMTWDDESGSGSDHETPAVEVETAQVTSGLFNTTYAIPSICNIPSDSAEHKVTVTFIDLKLNLSYVAVPCLSPYCFLKANVNNTSPFTILAGPANIFLVNNFIAKSKLQDASPNEYFSIHLGVDQSVRITTHPTTIVRGNTRSLTKQSNQTITSTHVIDVKNTKDKGKVNIDLSDQLPLSTDERIKVTLVEPNLKRRVVPHGYVILKPNANNLEWHLDLPPDTEVSLKVEYTVEYPPNCFVEGLP